MKDQTINVKKSIAYSSLFLFNLRLMITVIHISYGLCLHFEKALNNHTYHTTLFLCSRSHLAFLRSSLPRGSPQILRKLDQSSQLTGIDMLSRHEQMVTIIRQNTKTLLFGYKNHSENTSFIRFLKLKT